MARLIVLASLGCTCLLAAVATARENGLAPLLDVTFACGLAFVLAIVLVRHIGLGLVISTSPLPGMLAALGTFCAGDSAAAGLALAAGLTAAMLTGTANAGRSTRVEPEDAIFRPIARMKIRLMALMIGLFVLAAVACRMIERWSEVPKFAAAAVLAIVSVGVVQSLAAPLLDFGEAYVARSNRTRELFVRLALPFSPVAHRRFGFSVFGIAVVLGAIAYFGARQTRHFAMIDLWFIPAVGVVSLAAVYAVIRDWRRCLSVTGSLALAVVVGIWVAAKLGLSAAPVVEAMWLSSILLCLILQTFVAQEAALDIVTEDDVVAGSERGLELRAVTLCTVSALAAAVALPFLWSVLAIWATFALTLLANTIAAVVIQPAIAITIENLFPRAATVAARYRIG
ncbi:MAG: hypothetical protein ABSD74_19415 [Rhizomicrobium sp.]